MRKYPGHIIVFILISVLSVLVIGCTPQDDLPTLVPTPLPIQASETPPPTETPLPRATLTPLPTQVSLLPQTIARTPEEQALIRIVHASPELGTLDVYIENLNVAGFLSYKQFTQPSELVAGTYVAHIVPADGRLDSALLSEEITVRGETTTLLVIGGTSVSPELLVTEENNRPLRSGESRLKFINMVVDSGGLALSKTDNTVLTSSVGFSGSQSDVILRSTFETFGIVRGSERVQDVPVNLRERHQYTLIATGYDDAIESIIISSAVPGLSALRLVGATHDTNLYDVYLGAQFMGEIGDFVASELTEIVSGFYDVSIYAQSSSRDEVAPLLTANLNVEAGDRLTVVLIGDANSLRLVRYEHDSALTPHDEARITFLSALPIQERIRLNSYDSGELLFGRMSESLLFGSEPTLFDWEAINRAGEFLQTVETTRYTPQAGWDYLYIVTGSTGEVPQIYGVSVGTLPEDTGETVMPVDASLQAPRVRFVNAVENVEPDFRLNEVSVVRDIAYGQASVYQEVAEGEFLLTVVDPVAQRLLAREFVVLEGGEVYSIYVHGVPNDYHLTIVSDEAMLDYRGERARVRLVNLTATAMTRFGLALGFASQPVPQIEQTPLPFVPPQDDDADEQGEGFTEVPMTDPNRRSLPVGALPILSNVESRTFSAPAPLETDVGTRNIYIVDNLRNMIAETIYSYAVEDGKQYEIIAYQRSQSTQVRAFVIEYTAR